MAMVMVKVMVMAMAMGMVMVMAMVMVMDGVSCGGVIRNDKSIQRLSHRGYCCGMSALRVGPSATMLQQRCRDDAGLASSPETVWPPVWGH